MDTKEALLLSRTPHIVKLMIEDLKDDEDAQRLEGHLDVVQGIILELAKERDAQAAELTRLRDFARSVNETPTLAYKCPDGCVHAYRYFAAENAAELIARPARVEV